MAPSVHPQDRYTRNNRCPICGGGVNDKQGIGKRCHGFRSEDSQGRGYAHCGREELAGGIKPSGNPESYAHILEGPCNCGQTHGPARDRSMPTWKGPEAPKRNLTKDEGGEFKPATYAYQDALGNEVCRKERRPKTPKGMWTHCDSDGKCVSGLGSEEPQLYRLPEVLNAVSGGDTVYVVEGEKDADTLRALDLCATTPPHGVGSWLPEYSAFLKGAHVVVIADKDEPGFKHAREVYQSVGVVAADVALKIAAEGKDVTDHIDAGLGLEDLQDITIGELSQEGKGDQSLASRFSRESRSIRRMLAEPPPAREFVIQDVIPRGKVGTLYAKGGVGKGHLINLFSICIATGKDIGALKVPRPGRVLYLSCEDESDEAWRRIRAAVFANFGEELPELRGQLEENFAYVDLYGLARVELGDDLLQVIKETAADMGGVDLIIVDPLMKVVPGHLELNSQVGAGQIISLLDQVAKETGAAVVFVHHINKASAKDGSEFGGGALTGSQLLEDLCRFAMAMKVTKEPENLGLLEEGHYVELQLTKVNYSPELGGPFVFRRGDGGALVPVEGKRRNEVMRDRMFALLMAHGEWVDTEAFTAIAVDNDVCNKNQAKSLRKDMKSADLVETFKHPRTTGDHRIYWAPRTRLKSFPAKPAIAMKKTSQGSPREAA